MEVLAAIGLASNLIQFVDCLTKVVKSCWNLWYHEEVCLEESRELEIAVKSLQEILGKLESDTACSIDDTLIGLIQDCSKLTTDLPKILDRFQRNEGRGSLTSSSKASFCQ